MSSVRDIFGVYQCYLSQSEHIVLVLRPVQMRSNCLSVTSVRVGAHDAVLLVSIRSPWRSVSNHYAILLYFEPNLNLRECEIQYYFYNPANHDESDKLEWPDLAQESSILDG